MKHKLSATGSSFFLGLFIHSCSNSQFSSKTTPTQTAQDVTKNTPTASSENELDDQSLNTEPSLSEQKIEKVRWHGCCPSIMEFDSSIEMDPSGDNWAAKAYSKIESFYFERLGSENSGNYKIEKKTLDYYSDENCMIPIKDEVIRSYNVTPSHTSQNIASAVSNLRISSDGLSAKGIHAIRNNRGSNESTLEQKVEYQISDKTLRETITLNSNSLLPISRGYKITCNLRPLKAK